MMIPDNKDVDDNSPWPTGDLEFDTSVTFSTAWESAPGRKARRQYGRTKSQKKKAKREVYRKLNRSKSQPVGKEGEITQNYSGSTSDLSPSSPPGIRCNLETSDGSFQLRSKHGAKSYLSPTSPPRIFHQHNPEKSSRSSCRMLKQLYRKQTSMNSISDNDVENWDPNRFLSENTTLTPQKLVHNSKARSMFGTMKEEDQKLKARPRKIRALACCDDLQKSFSDLAKDVNATTAWDNATPTYTTSLAFTFEDTDSSPHGSVTTNSSRKRTSPHYYNGGLPSDNSPHDLLTDNSPNDSGLRRPKSRSRIYTLNAVADNTRSRKRLGRQKQSILTGRNKSEMLDSDDGGGTSDDDMICSDLDKSTTSRSNKFEESYGRGRLITRHSSLPNFETAIFGAASCSRPMILSSETICSTMPSVSDLKFLIKSLRKEKRRVDTSFGKVNMWTLSLPSQWSSERRTMIWHWSRELGFTMRSGGPSVVFLNISSSHAPGLLIQLEDALSYYQSVNGNRTPFKGEKNAFANILSAEKPRRHSNGWASSYDEDEDSTRFQHLDEKLVHGVMNLNLTSAESKTKRLFSMEEFSVRPTRALSFRSTISVDSTISVCESTPEDEPIIHSRFSGEHVMGGRDMVNHINAASPRRSRRLRPSRNRSLRTPKLQVNKDAILPAISPFPGESSSMQVCLETPHMTRRTCLERPKKGTDWGVSTPCSEEKLKELTKRLDAKEKIAANFAMIGAFDGGYAKESRILLDNREELNDNFEDSMIVLPSPPNHRNSMGITALEGLNLLDEMQQVEDYNTKMMRRRIGSIAKHRRVSLCANTIQHRYSLRSRRKKKFSGIKQAEPCLTLTDENRFSFAQLQLTESLDEIEEMNMKETPFTDTKILAVVFSFLNEKELLCKISPVSSLWSEACTEAHAHHMLSSVGCSSTPDVHDDFDDSKTENLSIMLSMEKSWKYLVNQYPWACFLSEGAFKRVFKVWNKSTGAEEAVSVMDIELIESTGNKNVVGAELAVSAMLSSLVRRNICPNFVLTRRVFTCVFEPPASHWGSGENRNPKGKSYNSSKFRHVRKPREPKKKEQGKYQYMRMELCSEGDAEEYLKRQESESISPVQAQHILFQTAFALYAAADRFCLKHYDMKLLNIFMQRPESSSDYTTLRYGIGSHVFALRMRTENTVIAKLADYGTANIEPESNGRPATIGQFTTLENTPPEFMILGDAAKQGHGHDMFGLGLCMLHLFTGHAPYEEILEDVVCPSGFKKKLRNIWENENFRSYSVIRSVILADVYTNEDGDVIDGEPDEVLYDTLYRFLVLFGIPELKYQVRDHGKVWKAITSSLEDSNGSKTYGNRGSKKRSDAEKFKQDQDLYSIEFGSNKFISRARKELNEMDGGLELLFALCSFDPDKRATASDVLNSQFMAPLREDLTNIINRKDTTTMSFLTYATK